MSDTSNGRRGGFSIGNVGGNVTMSASGDIIGGDKTVTSTIQRGFAAEAQKAEFQAQIDELRSTLQAIKAQIDAEASLTAEQKETIGADILRHDTELKEVKDNTSELTVGVPASSAVGSSVEATLDRAGGLLGKLKGLVTSGGDFGAAVADLASKYGPMIMTARHLFGLP